MLLEPVELRFLRRKHQITQQALAERLGLSTSWIQQVEGRKTDPRMSTMVKFRDALLSLIDDKQAADAEEYARRLQLVESDPKNAWLLDAYKKRKAYARGHKLEWVRAKSSRYVEGRTAHQEDET